MFKQINEEFSKNSQVMQNFFNNPQKLWSDYQLNIQKFNQVLNNSVQSIPTEFSNYVKDQQETLQKLNNQVTDFLKTQPTNFLELNQIFQKNMQENILFY